MIRDQHQRVPTRDRCHRQRVYAPIQICHMSHTRTNQLEVNECVWSMRYLSRFKAINSIVYSISIADSPKLRNKTQNSIRYNRNANAVTKKPLLSKTKAKSVAHDIVVVREANRKFGPDRDPDLQKLQV